MKAVKIIIIFFLTAQSAIATHMQGSEIYASYLGGNAYRVDIISHYKTVSSIPFIPEPFQILKIYERANGINLIKTDSIPLNSGQPAATNPCVVFLFNDVIVTYTDTLIFDSLTYSDPGGYLLVNSYLGTTNYNNSLQTVREIYTLIPPGYGNNAQIVNSSPKPNLLLDRPLICSGEEFSFDLSATDADGDSLNYRFFTPADFGAPANGMMNVYSAPYDYPPTQFNPVQWASGFSETNQINGAAPNDSLNRLDLNLISGELTVKAANQSGRFLVAVAIEEFRDIDNDGFDELIGAVYRVLSFEVQQCTWKVNDPPQMEIAQAPSNSVYSCNTPPPPGSNIYTVCVDSINEFVLTLTDNNPNSNYIFEVEGLNATIQDSVATLVGLNDTIQNSIFFSAGINDLGSLKEIKVLVTDTSECRNTFRDTLVFYINPQIISPLNDYQGKTYSTYPNPANDALTISGISDKAVFEVFDIHGKKIKSETLNDSNNSINTSELREGLYFYQLNNQRGKFLIQR